MNKWITGLFPGKATIATVFTSCVVCGSASGQIYVVNNGNVGEYSLLGTPVNTNLSSVYGSTISGDYFYAADYSGGTVSQYTLSGDLVQSNLITGLTGLSSVKVSGGNLFVSYAGAGYTVQIGKYTLSGAPLNTNLISVLSTGGYIGDFSSGGNIFLYLTRSSDITWIAEYTPTGTLVTTNFGTTPGSFAISGTNIFVADRLTAKINEYTFAGAMVATNLIPGLNAYSIAISSGNLFVSTLEAYPSVIIGQYTLSGATVNPTFISGLLGSGYLEIIVDPSPRFTSIHPVDARTFSLAFDTLANRTYVLQSLDGLAYNPPTNWSNLFTATPQPTNSHVVYVDSTTNQSRFYRLSASP